MNGYPDERHLAIELMSRVAAFAEAVLGAGTETTAITRDGDAPFGCFTCEIFARHYHFELRSAGPSVQLLAQSLDDHGDQQVLLTEVLSSDEQRRPRRCARSSAQSKCSAT